tara:strand:- start:325 stop:825 length:501 start_codon:yes stop_codon:yes gene_type:complete
MEIVDDFIEQNAFDKLQAFIMGKGIDWYYKPTIDFPEDVNKFQFVHGFYIDGITASNFITEIFPILNKIDPKSLYRVKANLLTWTPNIIENAFHVDMTHLPEKELKKWSTSIFYVNTNNGYTEFEDGSQVESVANRMVIFPADLKHRGTSSTNEKTRIVINFNYFK